MSNRANILFLFTVFFVFETINAQIIDIDEAYSLPQYIQNERSENSFEIVANGKSAKIYVDPDDWKGVIIATNNLSNDIYKVSGTSSLVAARTSFEKGSILIGTIGKSRIIDQLIAEKKIDVSGIRGKWESFLIATVDGNLVVAGSDKRGTIFGIYDISEKIGVSLGHIPSTCNNIDEFDAIVAEIGQYDEILTDMEMETFSGIDVLNRIKYSGINIPITIVTAREDVDYDDFIRMGFKAYVKKPVSISDLKLLFGGQIKDERKTGFSSLNKMLEEDSDALHEVLISFVQSTAENVSRLKQALLESDFNTAQLIGHKMQPMFIQLAAVDKLDILKKLDAHRLDATAMYPDWESDVFEFIEYAEQIINDVQNYLDSH